MRFLIQLERWDNKEKFIILVQRGKAFFIRWYLQREMNVGQNKAREVEHSRKRK